MANSFLPQGRDRSGVYARLKEAVVLYRFLPNEHLHVTALAQSLGVSETPVREVLTRLHAEGLVLSIPGRGYFAKLLTVEEMAAHYEMASLILRHAVGRNAARLTLAGLSRPPEMVQDPQSPPLNGNDELCRSHALFVERLFERLVQLSGNPVMIEAVQRFIDQTRFIRLIDIETNGIEIAADMADLIGALERQDAGLAIANLHEQLRKKLARLPSLVQKGQARCLAQGLPGAIPHRRLPCSA
jgi:DNA-binding GntR family transcriptional regulator